MAAPITISDTVFYGDGGPTLANLATDDSQFATNLTPGTNAIAEASSARMLQNTERTIDVLFSADNTHAGVFWSYGGQRLSLTAGGTVNIIVNSSTVLAFDATSLFSGSSRPFLVTWAMEPNPGGSGSTAMRSDVYVWNTGSGGFVRGSVLHAVPTATLTTAVIWAQTSAGSNAFTGTRTAFRFSTAYHSATETAEELLSASSSPTLAGEERSQILVPPQSTGLGDDGHLAGPIAALAAAAVRQDDLRLAGPLVNLQARSRLTHRGDRVGNPAFTLLDPAVGNNGRYLYLSWLCYRPIPPGVNRCKGRVFVQQWRTTGTADDLYISLYSMNRPGWTHRPAISPLIVESYRNTQMRSSNDGTGATAGAWVTFDNLRIARDVDGWSYFALGFEVVDRALSSGLTADQLWTVKSLIVDPIFESQGDGLPGLGG